MTMHTNNTTVVWGPLVSLAKSRKFWLAFVVAVSCLVMYVKGAITAEVLAEALTTLGTILMLAIAGEDISKSLAPKK